MIKHNQKQPTSKGVGLLFGFFYLKLFTYLKKKFVFLNYLRFISKIFIRNTIYFLAKIQNFGKRLVEVYFNLNLILMLSMISSKHTQTQHLGHSRFYTKIEAIVGLRHEPKPRGRQKKAKR